MSRARADERQINGSGAEYVVRKPSLDELERAGRRLVEVLLLAEQLPTRHSRTLDFPPLTRFKSTRR